MLGNLCRRKSRVLKKGTTACQGSGQAVSVRHHHNSLGEDLPVCSLQPDHSIPYLEPFLAASLPHSSCNSSSRPGTYSLQIRRASLHMPASCTSTTGRRNFTSSPGSPHSWRHITHLASHVILPEDQLEETTTAAPSNSSLPQNGTGIYPFTQATSGKSAHPF